MNNWQYKENNINECHIIADIERYIFSEVLSVEFAKIKTKNFGKGKYQGKDQFRIDFTKEGRFECEFLDNTFSYRSENEITILSTPISDHWVKSASLPGNYYEGCVILIDLTKLSKSDSVFELFDISINDLINKLGIIQKWYKVEFKNEFIATFNKMYELNRKKDIHRIYLATTDILLMLKNIDIPESKKNDETIFFNSNDVNTVKKIYHYILANYKNNIIFSDLIDQYSISYTKFNKIFKEVYGLSPYKYLKSCRILESKKLLKESDLSIIEIANEVGYSNASKFSDSFKSIVGKLPREFRKNK